MEQAPFIFSLVDKFKSPLHKFGVGEKDWDIDRFHELALKNNKGLDNFGDLSYRSGLNALLCSIKNLKSMHLIGEITFQTLIANALTNRLRYNHILSQNGSEKDLKPPIIIAGLSRSGTTFLQRLASYVDGHYAFPLWELLNPFDVSKPDRRRSKTSRDIYLKNLLLPELDKKHFTRADTKEECMLLLANSFHSQLFTDIAPLADYQEWYIKSDRDYAYAEYKAQLSILQQYHRDQTFVLKAPNHVGSLSNLKRHIPEAVIVQTHRNPVECINSLCSLRQTLFKMLEMKIDEKEIMRQILLSFDHELKLNMDFQRDNPGSCAFLFYSAGAALYI